MNETQIVRGLSDQLWMLEEKFNVDAHKVHMMRCAVDVWESDSGGLRVTDLLSLYTSTSRATTHRMIRELIASKLLKGISSIEDKRVKLLVPGQKFEAYVKAIGDK